MTLIKKGRKLLQGEAKATKGKGKSVIRKKAKASIIDLTRDEDTAGSNADHTVLTDGEERSSLTKSSTGESTRAKQDTLFHILPGELRNRIYHYTCLKSVRLELQKYQEPALSLAIPDFRPEVATVILSQNQLEAIVHTTFIGQETDKSYSRRADRGDKYGAGNLAIPADSWVWKVDPGLVKIRNIGLRIDEMGGYPLGDFFMNVRKVKLDKEDPSKKIGKFGQRVENADGSVWEVTASFKTKSACTSRYTRQAMTPMAELARARVNKIVANGGPCWNGFSWDELREVAKSFADLERAKGMVWTKKAKENDGKERRVVECLLEDEELVDESE